MWKEIFFFFLNSVHFMVTERGLSWFLKRVKPILFSSFSQIPKLLEQHLLVKSPVFFHTTVYIAEKLHIVFISQNITHVL